MMVKKWFPLYAPKPGDFRDFLNRNQVKYSPGNGMKDLAGAPVLESKQDAAGVQEY
jgi:hypothetical protein